MTAPYLSPGVYVREVEPGSRPIEGVGTAVAAFLGLAPQGPFNTPTLVTNWSQFTRTFGGYVEETYLAHAVFGYFNNGGGSCYIVRLGDGGSPPPGREAVVELPSADDPDAMVYRVRSKEPGPSGNEITVVIEHLEDAEDQEASFRLVARRGTTEEPFEGVTLRSGPKNVAVVVNAASTLIEIEEVGRASPAKRLPAAGTYSLAGGGAVDVARISSEDYIGSPEQRTGFGSLQAVDEITMLCVPDLMAAYQGQLLDLDGVQAVQQAMIDHCEGMGDRMAILDAPPAFTAQQVKEWRVDKARYDAKQAALYWPWISVFDPVRGHNVSVPPCGHIAGIWSRSDDSRGVHKAPANEVVRGALDLDINVTRGEHDQLNPEGINAIRSFPGRGIRVWGARTLSSDSSWRYVNVRRLFNYLEESIIEGTQWVVFEPNDHDLWQRIRRTVTAFLLGLWRNGALFGATPDQAFYVKCDEETNPPDVVESGQVVVELGVSVVKPAEFVVFRVQQFPGGAQVSE